MSSLNNELIIFKKIVQCELEVIKKGFLISSYTGREFLKTSINSFVVSSFKDGSFNADNLNKFIFALLEGIEEEDKPDAIAEVLLLPLGDIKVEEILNTIGIENE